MARVSLIGPTTVLMVDNSTVSTDVGCCCCDATLTCISISASKTKCGFGTYIETNPPKVYLRKDFRDSYNNGPAWEDFYCQVGTRYTRWYWSNPIYTSCSGSDEWDEDCNLISHSTGSYNYGNDESGIICDTFSPTGESPIETHVHYSCTMTDGVWSGDERCRSWPFAGGCNPCAGSYFDKPHSTETQLTEECYSDNNENNTYSGPPDNSCIVPCEPEAISGGHGQLTFNGTYDGHHIETLTQEYTTEMLKSRTIDSLPEYGPWDCSGTDPGQGCFCWAYANLSSEISYTIQRFKYKWIFTQPQNCILQWRLRTFDLSPPPGPYCIDDKPMSMEVTPDMTESPEFEVQEPEENGTTYIIYPDDDGSGCA